jgi:hypothetical protein
MSSVLRDLRLLSSGFLLSILVVDTAIDADRGEANALCVHYVWSVHSSTKKLEKIQKKNLFSPFF